MTIDLHGWRGVAAAGLSGALLAASLPPQGVPAIVFVALVPLLAVLRARTSWREGLRLGYVAGVVMMAIGYPWFVGLFQVFGDLPLVAALAIFAVYCSWSAVPIAVWAALMVALPRTWAWPLLAALGFTGLWWSWPALLPFTVTLGLASQPAFIQGAELGGAALIEVLVVGCSVCVVEALARRGARRGRWLAAAAAIPALMFALGSWRIASLEDETTRTIRFGLVQPNIPLLWEDEGADQEKLRRLREPSAAAQAGGAEIVVWPENMYPWPLDRPMMRDVEDEDRVLALHSLPTLFGAGSIADDEAYAHNTAFYMTGDGAIRNSYDKVLLVPLGEHIPLVDPDWATAQMPGLAHNIAGTGPTRFIVEPGPPGSGTPVVSLGPLICYEDVFAEFARQVAGVVGGVEVFVNLSNDTWFGARSEAWQHQALAQFRSVEHRIPMVRSVNSGPSAAIDRAGRIVAMTAQRAADKAALVPAELLLVDVAIGRDTERAPTLFARFGWLLVYGCRALALGLLIKLWLQGRRTRRKVLTRAEILGN
jgi:apolipoprotein N-acyltransferase